MIILKSKNLEMQLKDLIRYSYSLARKKFHYNNDKCFLLDGLNSREIKVKDLEKGHMIKLGRHMKSVIITGTPELKPHIYGGYKWSIPSVEATRIKDVDEIEIQKAE